MAWTIPQDIIDAWIGDDAPDDDDKLQVWIDRAEREIRYRVPDLEARAMLDSNMIDVARDVVVAMVTRVFRNPRGWRQVQVTTGPFSESGTVGGDNPGTLYLTDDELAKLQGAKSSGAFTVDMIPVTSPFSAHYTYPVW
jgi:hypothetical protein